MIPDTLKAAFVATENFSLKSGAREDKKLYFQFIVAKTLNSNTRNINIEEEILTIIKERKLVRS